jgi:hypothetical protein
MCFCLVYIADISKPLGAQQFLKDLRGEADYGVVFEADRGDFRRRLRHERSAAADQTATRSPDRGHSIIVACSRPTPSLPASIRLLLGVRCVRSSKPLISASPTPRELHSCSLIGILDALRLRATGTERDPL